MYFLKEGTLHSTANGKMIEDLVNLTTGDNEFVLSMWRRL